MEEILKHVNEKLTKHKLQLIDDKVLEEHKNVMKSWEKIAVSFTKPVKFLIVGEATVSWDNYFYNSKADTTSFLSPSHFGCKDKKALIQFFGENGILVFDLYPLPLPTFIYDKVAFDCDSEAPYVKALIKYYAESLLDKGLINPETVIVSRYAKFYKEKQDENDQVIKNKAGKVVLEERRFEWGIFMKTIGRDIIDFKSIYGGFNADILKVQKVFNIMPKKEINAK
jgi:hypothetical protein